MEGLVIRPRHAAPREREDVFGLGRLSQRGYGFGSEIEVEAEVEVAVAVACGCNEHGGCGHDGVAFPAPLIPAPLIPWEKIVRLRSGAHGGARSRPKKPRLRH